MISRKPRQIVGFDVAYDKSPDRIQAIVDSAFDAEKILHRWLFGIY